MNFFGKKDQGSEHAHEDAAFVAARAKLDRALTSVFNEAGKKAVLYYMENRYSLTLEQASSDPVRLESAMIGLLGDIGWLVVKRKIIEQFWGREIGLDEPVLMKSSLRDAIGVMGGFGKVLGFAPRIP